MFRPLSHGFQSLPQAGNAPSRREASSVRTGRQKTSPGAAPGHPAAIRTARRAAISPRTTPARPSRRITSSFPRQHANRTGTARATGPAHGSLPSRHLRAPPLKQRRSRVPRGRPPMPVTPAVPPIRQLPDGRPARADRHKLHQASHAYPAGGQWNALAAIAASTPRTPAPVSSRSLQAPTTFSTSSRTSWLFLR